MAQLKMYRLPDAKLPKLTLPEGYSISRFSSDADIPGWIACCMDGSLIDEANGEQSFEDTIRKMPGIVPERDVFFLDHNGQHVATATTFIRTEDGAGCLHMVGMRTEYRGKGLSKYITCAALENLEGKPIPFTRLLTDEFRLGAIKTYLDFDFLPVEYDVGMLERWEQVLGTLGVDSVQMLCDDAAPFRTIYRPDGNR